MKYPAESLRRFAPTTAVAALASAIALGAVLYAGTGVTAIPESADSKIVRPAHGFADLVEAVRPSARLPTSVLRPEQEPILAESLKDALCYNACNGMCCSKVEQARCPVMAR